jgi:hypothetical protein
VRIAADLDQAGPAAVDGRAQGRECGDRPTGSAGGCWSGAVAAPESWRSTAATHPRWCHFASWSASSAGGGPWRSLSRPRRD